MPETRILLIYLLTTAGILGCLGFALITLIRSNRRVLDEQQRAIEAERIAMQSRESLMDNAHHELKTPLQIILGNLEVLSEVAEDPAQVEILACSIEAAERLRTLVQGLLDLSALEHGTYKLQPDWIDLSHLLESLASDMAIKARSKGLSFVTEWNFPYRNAWIDGPSLLRVMNFLIDNAITYTEQGEVVFRALSESSGNRLTLTFEVDDTGPGLSKGSYGLQIKPLFHGTQAMGLGIPLATGLIRRMDGELTLVRLNHGTRARVQLTAPLPQMGGDDPQSTGGEITPPLAPSLDPDMTPEPP